MVIKVLLIITIVLLLIASVAAISLIRQTKFNIVWIMVTFALLVLSALSVLRYIAKINIDEAEAIALEYNVMSIPTVILFKNGEEIKRNVGGMSAGEVLNILKD